MKRKNPVAKNLPYGPRPATYRDKKNDYSRKGRKQNLLENAHEMAQDLFNVGAIDEDIMKEFNELTDV